VRGRPTLDYVLTAVRCAGIERACVVTRHLEEQIFEYVGDGSQWGLDVTFAHQNELRGTGDALMSIPRKWLREEPIMIIATDYILRENDLLELVRVHEENRVDITMSLKQCPMDELIARSSVDVDSDWCVKRIIEKPTRQEIMSPYAASILFILPPQLWDYLAKVQPSPRGEIEMQAAVQRMLEDGFTAYGLLQPVPEEWDAALHLTPIP
jgi:dTDP-glucose pyrophosphorylase